MTNIERAKQLRLAVQFQAAALPDEQAALVPTVFPPVGTLGASTRKETRVQYGELLYKCLQSHTAQADWTPDAAVSRWVRIDDPAEEWPEWRQPQGAHDAYALGAKVSAQRETLDIRCGGQRMGAGGVRLDGGGVNGQLHHAGGA